MARNELVNALQAMSNTAADTVAGPVDGLAWLMRKAGIPVPQNAFMGSDWMRQKGLLGEVRPGASQLVGETAGLLSPVVAAAKAPQIARGLLNMGENLAQPSTVNRLNQRGMILYHGTQDARPLKEIHRGGTFGGLFASTDKNAARSHGDDLYRMTVPDEQVLTQQALDYDIPYERVQAALKGYPDEVLDLVQSGKSAFSRGVDEDALMAQLRADSLGEADWALQGLRGKLANRLGFKAVEMPDEHGMSYLVTPGTKPRPVSESAKQKFRK